VHEEADEGQRQCDTDTAVGQAVHIFFNTQQKKIALHSKCTSTLTVQSVHPQKYCEYIVNTKVL
jgi:hypothetical protein